MQGFKAQVARRQDLVRGLVDREKRREAELVKRLSKELGSKIRQRAEGNLDENRQRIEQLKGRERLLPFKLRYLQHKKQERLRELLHKSAEEQEAVVRAKLQELEGLDMQENVLFQQLRGLSSRHLFGLPSKSGADTVGCAEAYAGLPSLGLNLRQPHAQGRNHSFDAKPALSVLV